MYVNALRDPSCHQSGSTSACVELSHLLYISLYSRQGPASSARYKRRVESRPGCTVLCTLTKEVQVWGQSRRCPAVDFLHWSLEFLKSCILSTEPREDSLFLACSSHCCGQSYWSLSWFALSHQKQILSRAYLSGYNGTSERPASGVRRVDVHCDGLAGNWEWAARERCEEGD